MAALRRLGSLGLAQRYNYVVVGGGSAGCVVASRLVREHGATVLLLEAGASHFRSWDFWKIDMPAALTFNLADDKYNWDYYTVPQAHMDGRQLHEPRGKVLGGSSSLNAMAYVRGHGLDFERWSEETGCPGWGYRHVLPYFKKAQRHQAGASFYRGADGPLHVCRKRTEIVAPINNAFIDAGVQAGYPRTDDMNGFQQEGFGAMDMTVKPCGTRASTAHCYLGPLLWPQTDDDRIAAKRLTVVTHAQALRLLFDGRRTLGVEVSSTGETQQLYADTEVILCAGAVGTPKLLMLSGIGDATELEAHCIEVRHHLPEVGKNLQDHLEFYIQFLAKHTSLYPYAATFGGWGAISRYLFRRPWNAIAGGLSWITFGKGVCATNHFEVGAFIRSAPGKRHPDIQYHFIPGCVTGQLEFLPEHGYQAHCGTMRPTSRGTVRLASKNPQVAPLIDPNFLATSEDIADMRNTFRLSMEILGQPAFDPFVLKRYSPDEGLDFSSDTVVDAWIRQNAHSAYHLSCTCAIGRVVDHEGSVLGLEGLRVADSSIMPSMTSGNLNAPTIMLAEKLADAVRGTSLPPDEFASWFEPDGYETKQR